MRQYKKELQGIDPPLRSSQMEQGYQVYSRIRERERESHAERVVVLYDMGFGHKLIGEIVGVSKYIAKRILVDRGVWVKGGRRRASKH